jgi:hypothetical protein
MHHTHLHISFLGLLVAGVILAVLLRPADQGARGGRRRGDL